MSKTPNTDMIDEKQTPSNVISQNPRVTTGFRYDDPYQAPIVKREVMKSLLSDLLEHTGMRDFQLDHFLDKLFPKGTDVYTKMPFSKLSAMVRYITSFRRDISHHYTISFFYHLLQSVNISQEDIIEFFSTRTDISEQDRVVSIDDYDPFEAYNSDLSRFALGKRPPGSSFPLSIEKYGGVRSGKATGVYFRPRPPSVSTGEVRQFANIMEQLEQVIQTDGKKNYWDGRIASTRAEFDDWIDPVRNMLKNVTAPSLTRKQPFIISHSGTHKGTIVRFPFNTIGFTCKIPNPDKVVLSDLKPSLIYSGCLSGENPIRTFVATATKINYRRVLFYKDKSFYKVENGSIQAIEMDSANNSHSMPWGDLYHELVLLQMVEHASEGIDDLESKALVFFRLRQYSTDTSYLKFRFYPKYGPFDVLYRTHATAIKNFQTLGYSNWEEYVEDTSDGRRKRVKSHATFQHGKNSLVTQASVSITKAMIVTTSIGAPTIDYDSYSNIFYDAITLSSDFSNSVSNYNSTIPSAQTGLIQVPTPLNYYLGHNYLLAKLFFGKKSQLQKISRKRMNIYLKKDERDANKLKQFLGA